MTRRILVLLALLFVTDRAFAYTTEDGMKPTGLTIQLVLDSVPDHDNFTRYLTFTNRVGATKSVAVDFVKTSNLHYNGFASAAGLAVLQTLADQNNRSYWDAMKFENKNGTTALSINTLAAQVEYADTCCDRSQLAPIALVYNQVLAAGNSSFDLPGSGGDGRIEYATAYLGITRNQFNAYPAALRHFIYDIGKAGSSDASDAQSSTNPKYGLTGQSLCSETVSWYYYEYGVHLASYDFRDTTAHTAMHDAFLNEGRLYCYHSALDQWIKKDANDNWVLADTYVPRPGDYLDRLDSDGDSSNGDDGHAAMLARWDANTGVATTIDGPWNINFLPLHVDADEAAGRFNYCIGRIPEND